MQVAPTKFCKVCRDAGKSEADYTNHWVRSALGPEGKVVCPTLLELECRYCFEHGHTVKYCPVVKKNEKNEKVKVYEKTKETKTEKSKPLNVFDCLADSDDEVKVKVVTKKDAPPKAPMKALLKAPVEVNDEFPALGQSKKSAAPSFSYATIASKSKDEYLNEQYMLQLAKKRMMPALVAKETERKAWIDYSDEEEEEEEEIQVKRATNWSDDDSDGSSHLNW